LTMRHLAPLRRYGASNIGCTDVDMGRKIEEGKVEREKEGKGEGEKEWKVKGRGRERGKGRKKGKG